jgi:ribosomal protein L37AE/L43A
LALAVSGRTQHGGNDGYSDDPQNSYTWDSTVQLHDAIRPGDVIAIWDKKLLLGVSVIEDIERSQTDKRVYKCPSCTKAGIKARQTKSPLYMCYKCKAEFDVPTSKPVHVTSYRSHHGGGWVGLEGALTGPQLRSLCLSPKSQLSFRELKWEAFCGALQDADLDPQIELVGSVARQVRSGHRPSWVRVRIGQSDFRRELRSQFGDVCAFTGPAPSAALEACHLYSYAAHGKHHEDGGLLLRADLHTLFDTGVIAVEPSTECINVSEEIRQFSEYARLHGDSIKVELTARHRRWLLEHWRFHRT